MTFYEAAVEVLKSAERPLHYKKITEIAIRRQLLSHVGKTPEVTMGTRLVQEVQRTADESEIVRTRPGVYALRIWETQPPAGGNGAPAEAGAEIGDEEAAEGGRRRQRRRRGGAGAEEEAATSETAPFSPVDLYADRALFGPDEEGVQDEEDTGVEEEEEEGEEDDEGAEAAAGSSRRRRRRRRRRGGGGADERRAPAAEQPERAQAQPERAQAQPERAQAREPRPEPRRAEPVAARREPLEGVVGGDAGSMAAGALKVLREANQPVEAERIVNALGAGPSGRASAATLAAALVTDNRVREAHGLRPHFMRLDDTRWGLTEWSLEKGVLRIEEHLQEAVHHLRRQTVEQLGIKLGQLTVDTWQHLVLALLKHIGYAVLGTQRRDERTIVVRAEHRVGLSTVYVAIELCDCDELSAEAVTELRGTLHHHGSSRGVIFTTGRVSDAALEESRIANLPPITLIGCDQLSQMLVDAGIGVHKLEIPVYYVDQGFFERLSGR